MKDAYWRRARLQRVIDGDTIQMVIDLGFYASVEHRVRLLGVNTAELHAHDTTLRTKALDARTFTTNWLAEHGSHLEADVDWPFVIRTEKADSFGRFLAFVECCQAHSLTDDLLSSGMAEVFLG
jgi:micrococcal nuclease